MLFACACGERPLEPRDPTPGAVHFVVKTYNVEVGDEGQSATIEAIGSGNADLVCLQETSSLCEKVLRKRYADQYPYQLYNDNAPEYGAGGLAVLSRFPLTDSGWHANPKGWHPAWHLLVETPAGTMQVMNLHLRAVLAGDGNDASSYFSTGDDHVAEIAYFLSTVEEELPTLIVGDFNEEPGGEAIEYLENRGFRNALPLYRPGQFTWRHASVANQFSKTFDHILFDGAFAPLNAWVLNEGDSDHIPVLAHLEAAYDWEPDVRIYDERRLSRRQRGPR